MPLACRRAFSFPTLSIRLGFERLTGLLTPIARVHSVSNEKQARFSSYFSRLHTLGHGSSLYRWLCPMVRSSGSFLPVLGQQLLPLLRRELGVVTTAPFVCSHLGFADYCSPAYSALVSFRMGMSVSAVFQGLVAWRRSSGTASSDKPRSNRA